MLKFKNLHKMLLQSGINTVKVNYNYKGCLTQIFQKGLVLHFSFIVAEKNPEK